MPVAWYLATNKYGMVKSVEYITPAAQLKIITPNVDLVNAIKAIPKE